MYYWNFNDMNLQYYQNMIQVDLYTYFLSTNDGCTFSLIKFK